MPTPSLGIGAFQQSPAKLNLNFLSAVLDSAVTFTRSGATATCVNASGYVQTVPADTPRFDYDPVSLTCQGLLVEEARTNLFNYSQILDNAYWSKTRLNTTGAPAWVDQAVSPDGTQNADKLIEDTSTNTHFIQRTYAAAANTTYTFSVFLKAAERTFATVQVGLFANQVASNVVHINLSTGQFTASDVNRTVVKNFGNGWWRVSTTVTTVASAVNIAPSVYVASALGTINYAGDGSSGIYAWGMQFEVGAFPTSYIPVEVSSLTRNEDVATMTGTNFSDWYSQTQGTFRIDAISIGKNNRPIICVDDNTANESLIIKTQGAVPTFVATDNGVEQASVTAGTISANTTMFAYASYASDYFGIARPSARQVSTSGTVPTPDRLRLGADNAASFFNGHLQQVRYWP